MLTYRDHIVGAMELLAENPRTVVTGYNATAGGTCSCFPPERRPEMPLAEALCAGVAIGLSLQGYIPILFIERMDFILIALDQLVNHASKLEQLSGGIHKPGMIIRTCIGNRNTPLLTGPTHCQDFSVAISHMVDFPIIKLMWSSNIIPEYKKALDRAINGKITMLIEDKDLFFKP